MSGAEQPVEPITAKEAEQRRGKRNLWIALSVVGFVVLVYFITIARLAGNVADRTF